MNAVEHIVECYFRYCKDCFTMTDVKVIGGNNRQCDLLAVNLKNQEQFHIESSVTHDLNWSPSDETLAETFNKKFRGIPPKREGAGTDHTKGKNYYENILETYRRVGFEPEQVKRVFVVWGLKSEATLQDLLERYTKDHSIPVQVLRFRDEILPELMEKVSTSNYDDEVLRTLSLLKQHKAQSEKLG